MVVFVGSAAFDRTPVDVSRFKSAIRNVPGAQNFETREIGDAGCAVAATPRHRLDEQVCTLEEHGPFVIAGSIRLHNQADLSAALAVSADRHVSDGVLVAHAFEKWGPNCAQKLFGEYGFMVWDRSDRKLFMVSDHIRSIRLYALREGGRILFSNHLEALQNAALEPLKIAPATVADFLKRPPIPAPYSFFDGVVSAQPGGYTEISAIGHRESVWWYPLDFIGSAKMSAKDCEAEFSHRVTAAVANCIEEDAIYGSHLTGGIDSGTVSLVASELLQKRGRSLGTVFSWTPPVSEENPHLGAADERTFLEAFAHEHRCKLVFGDTSAEDYYAFLRLPFELLGTADVVDELASIRQASREGVEVILSGWGGDEAFSAHGFGYVPWLLGQGRFRDVFRATRQISESQKPVDLLRKIWSDAVVPHLPDSLYRRLAQTSGLYSHNCFRSSWLDGYAKRDTQLQLAMRYVSHPHDFSMRLFATAYPGDRVETWRNWAAGKGLQYRYPLLDRALLEFMFSIPPDIAFGRGARNLAGRHFSPKLPQGLGKKDTVNEARRARTREQCLLLLQRDVQAGVFDAPCAFVDTDRLKRAMFLRPAPNKLASAIHFSELSGAVRGFYLYQRAQRNGALAQSI
jgi:asparagine synthase (glutamine-hydrolysing)